MNVSLMVCRIGADSGWSRLKKECVLLAGPYLEVRRDNLDDRTVRACHAPASDHDHNNTRRGTLKRIQDRDFVVGGDALAIRRDLHCRLRRHTDDHEVASGGECIQISSSSAVDMWATRHLEVTAIRQRRVVKRVHLRKMRDHPEPLALIARRTVHIVRTWGFGRAILTSWHFLRTRCLTVASRRRQKRDRNYEHGYKQLLPHDAS